MGEVGDRAAGPGAAEAGHAVTDVEEECLALLLAVVADIDAGGDLLAHDVAGRGFALGVDRGFVHRLAGRAARIQRCQS